MTTSQERDAGAGSPFGLADSAAGDLDDRASPAGRKQKDETREPQPFGFIDFGRGRA